MISKISEHKGRMIRLFVYIALFIVVVCLHPNALDNTSFCPLYLLTKTKCIGCGMTRAFVHMLHLDFEGAFAFNRLVVVYFPVVAILVAADSIVTLKKVFAKRENGDRVQNENS